jgi:hypothetical protein
VSPHDADPLQWGTTITLEVEPDDTIERVEAKLVESEGKDMVPASMLHIVFAGKGFQDDRTLADYNVQKDNVLRLLLKVHGE